MFRNRASTERQQRMMGVGEVELFAPGKAPALLAIHGFGGTAAEIMPVARAVADAGFAVDASLLPGHGTRVEQLQEQTFASWLAGARRRFDDAVARYGQVVVLGFSLGSLVALQIASERPAGLAGLVAMGNALTVRPHTSWPFALWELTRRPLPDVYLLKPRAGDLVDPRAMNEIVSYDRHPVRAGLEVYRAGKRLLGEVHRVECPTLILHGKRDMVCHWQNAPRLAELVGAKDVSVRLFERSAHVLCCDCERDEVIREVVTFVRRMGG
jgi:carboxylesterase